MKNQVEELHKTKPIIQTPLVVPITSNDKIIEAWNNFQELKAKLLDDSDFVLIDNENYPKKSAFRKLALAFGLTVEITKEERIELKNGFGYEISMKAIAPSGRSMSAVASCHSNERRFNKDSDVRAIAQTRCTNRSIADLVGWSQPSSAEEIMSEVELPKETDNIQKDQNDWISNISFDNEEEETGRIPSNDNMLTEKQHNLLVSLITEKIIDSDERERKLQEIESFNKSDASDAISSLIENDEY
jgi:hypothetical protein